MSVVPDLLKQAASRWMDDRCDRLAAALSYYALFSLFPLALLSLTGLGYVLGDDAGTRARLVGSFAVTGTPELRALIDQTLTSMQEHRTARGIGTIIGIATLLFGASGVFGELQNALNLIWRVPPAPSRGIGHAVLAAVKGKAISFVLVVAAALLLLTSLAASTALAAVDGSGASVLPVAGLWPAIELLGSAALLAPVLALMFRMLPQTRIGWRDVVWGALLTAVLFSIVKKLLAYYLAHVGSYAAYGVAGALLGLLTWIYVTSMLLFFGAELTRVYAERLGSLARGEDRRRAPQPTSQRGAGARS